MKYKTTKYFIKNWDKYEFTRLLQLVKLTFFNYIYQYLNQTLSSMNENPYAKLTLEQLKNQAKTVKTIMSIFSGMLLVLVFAVVFLGIRQGFSTISVIPVALLPILFVMLNNLKTIQEEIQSRESNFSK
jgi:SNF family Na+-dependent transporter